MGGGEEWDFFSSFFLSLPHSKLSLPPFSSLGRRPGPYCVLYMAILPPLRRTNSKHFPPPPILSSIDSALKITIKVSSYGAKTTVEVSATHRTAKRRE